MPSRSLGRRRGSKSEGAQPILAREVGTWVLPSQIAHAESEKTGGTHVAFFISSADLTIESLADVLPALSAHPLPTYLGGEKQRTCVNGLIWNIADGARPNPEGLSRSFRVDIDSMVG